ncbi:MAG: T9SS type B sorting domain-containing protein [Saprospiraceae bacterium]
MKELLRPVLLTVILLLLSLKLLAQAPPICGPSPDMTPFCSDACIICDIDGFSGVNGSPVPNWDVPAGFCAPIAHNLRWIGFIAGSVNLTLEIAVSNCTITPVNNQGLQMGVYEVIDCNTSAAMAVTNCDPRVRPGETAILTNTVPLVIGQYYYLCIDGRNNDVCDYDISVTNGSTQVPSVTQGGGITGPTMICSGVPATYSTNVVPNAPNHYWYIDGNPLPGSGQNYTINFPGPGTYEICVEASNTCSTAPQECMTVVVADIPPTVINGVICPGQCYPYLSTQFCAAGSFAFNFVTASGCDSLVTVVITELSAINVTLDTSACAGETVLVAGNQFATPGNYTITLPGVNTCDTTLTINVTEDPSFQIFETAAICQGSSFTFGSQVLTTPGTYTDMLTTTAGCDSTIELTLTVQAPVTTNLVETICFGASFTTGTQTYNTSGTFTENLQTTLGCDSTVTLNLTVLPELMSTETAEICDGQSFPFGGNTFNTAGSFPVVFTSVDGCDSTVTLDLTVFPNSQTALTQVICPGQSVMLGPNTYSTTGTFTEVFTNANGCDSTVTLNLTVQPSINVTENQTICDGQSFPFDGQVLTTGGTYSGTFTSVGGCDSIVTLNLTVAPNPIVNLVEIICDGDDFIVGPQTFTTTGTYTVLLTSAAGCDSTVNLDLTVQTAIVELVTAEICDGDDYTVGTQTFNVAGNYTTVLTSSAGCDSTVELTLIVNPTFVENIVATICDGDFYNVGGQGFSTAGSFSITLQTVSGCDSIIDLDLSVVQVLTETVNASICPGDSYAFNGSSYSTPGSYPFSLLSAIGCDSIVTLELDVLQPSTESISASICDGDTYSVGTQNYNTTGVFTTVLTSAAGCDSTVTLDLTVNQPQSVAITESFCQGGNYIIDGQVLTLAGSYNFVLTTTQGCDSLVALTLVVAPTYVQSFNATICPGTSYTFAGQTYTSAGQYSTVLTTVAGCDSLVTLNLTEEQLIETNLTASICTGQTYLFGGTTLTTAGSYNDLFTTSQGCDSLVLLELQVINSFDTQLAETICGGESFVFDGTPRTTTGTYTASLTSTGGCDSIVTLDLTVLPELMVDTTANLCFGESIQLGGQLFTTTGNYTVSLVNSIGCDSVITLTLNVSGGDTTRLNESVCSGDFVTVGTQQFTTTGNYTVNLTTSGGCDSTVILDLTVDSQVLLSQNESLCAGQSVVVRGTTYSTPGTFTINAPGAAGECDTVITLMVQIGSVSDSMLTVSICDGETYSFNGQVLSTAGTYTEVLTAANGCDSTVTLDLAVGQTSTTALSETICDGDSYTFAGQTLTTAGAYQDVLTGATGCDSLVTLTLTVNPTADSTINASICTGGTYDAGGQSFSASGTYTINVTTAANCDSTITLILTVDSQVALSQNEFLCPGDDVVVRGVTYNTPGQFMISIPGQAGQCDTALTLNVALGNASTESITETICAGEAFPFDGQSLTAAGNYSATLTNASGCDSIINLALSVLPATRDTTVAVICDGDSYSFDGRTFAASGNYTATFTSANGCDSLVTLALTVLPPLNASATQSICVGDSYTLGGQTFTSSGTYTVGFTTNAGCDSNVVLALSVVDSIVVDLQETICEGDSFVFAGSTLTDAGTYSDISTSSLGCDSVTTLTLAVTPIDNETFDATICNGDSFPFAGQVYNTAGSYSNTLVNQAGCDSIVVLNLAVVDSIEVALNESICQGSTYNFGSQALTTSGTYRDVSPSSAGCDSITTLVLLVSDTVRSSTNAFICAGDSYPFDGTNLTTAGTYNQRGLTSSGGCDSVATLILTVGPIATSTVDTIVCTGEVVRIGGQQFSGTGAYNVTLTAANGCDSLLTLNITETGCSFNVEVEAQDARCFGEASGTLLVTLDGAVAPVTITYINSTSGATGDTTLQTIPAGGYTFTDLGSGTYNVTVVDDAGNSSSASDLIEQPAAPVDGDLVISDYNGYQISCDGAADGQAQVTVSGGTQPYRYSWSNDMITASISSLDTGVISVTVVDENGCPWEDQANLTAPGPLDPEFLLTPISCENPEVGGAIEIIGIDGGTPPYTRLINSQPLDPAGVVSLAAGSYLIEVTDVNGCTAIPTTFDIEEADEPKIDVGADRTIVLGDTVRIDVLSTLTLDSLWFVTPMGYMSCTTCPDPWVSPQLTTDYLVRGITEEGCIGEDIMRIIVRRDDVIFVPTGFSPNGDGVNDQFTVFVKDQDAIIEELRVFDRWGESMFVGINMAQGIPTIGWDGTFRGQLMDPAVFVYWAKVRFRDGRTEVVRGDISLIR